MIQRFKNIETAFQYIRTFSLFFLIGCVVLSGYALFGAHRLGSMSEQKIYVLANDKAVEAYASNRKDNIAVEARDHVRTFHERFFTLAPDDKAIQANLNRALYLADRSAKSQYDNLRENGYYASIISGNISQTITIDSVLVDIRSHPYYFYLKAEESIVRSSSKVTRSLKTEGYLRSVSRSDNNPHGFLIERWRILENKDLTTQNR